MVTPCKAAHHAESEPAQSLYYWEPCNANAQAKTIHRNSFWKPYKATIAETVHIEGLF